MPIIYVALLDEGADVWRPVTASHLDDDRYLILKPTTKAEDELWEFQPGMIVRCSEKVFSGGVMSLVAKTRVVAEPGAAADPGNRGGLPEA